MNAQDFLSGLSGVKKNGKGWYACCPAHHDKNASLHVSDGEKGLLLKCFAGCSAHDIVLSRGMELKELFHTSSELLSQWRTFPIKTVQGHLVAIRKRRGSGKKKKLLWEQPNGKPGLANRKTCDLPLYGSEQLPGFDRSRWVELSEGEAKTYELQLLGAQAVGTVTGASSLPSRQVLSSLKGFKVRLWPDNDDAGRLHMSRISNVLRELGCEVMMLDTRGLPEKGDAVEWIQSQLANGRSKAELRLVLEQDQLPGLSVATQELPAETKEAIIPRPRSFEEPQCQHLFSFDGA